MKRPTRSPRPNPASGSLVIVEGVADVGLATVGGNSGIALLLSVTDANGTPYTGLQAQNFQVQVMFDWMSGADSKVFMFFEENKNGFMHEHLPGIYALVFNNTDNVWSPVTYTAIVKVKAGQNQGQTLIQFSVPSE